MFAEVFWINKKGWANFGRAFVFSTLSNFIGFAVGLFVFFAVFARIFYLSASLVFQQNDANKYE